MCLLWEMLLGNNSITFFEPRLCIIWLTSEGSRFVGREPVVSVFLCCSDYLFCFHQIVINNVRVWAGVWILALLPTSYVTFGEGNGNPLRYSCLENCMDGGAWWAAVHEVAGSWTRLSDLTFTFHFHALEKEMATHPSVLAWRIPGTGEPGGLLSMGSHRVG